MFFIVLLNKALCDLKKRIPTERPKAYIGLPEDAEYADDTYFFSTDEEYLQQMLPCVELVFRGIELKVNTDKTEKLKSLQVKATGAM